MVLFLVETVASGLYVLIKTVFSGLYPLVTGRSEVPLLVKTAKGTVKGCEHTAPHGKKVNAFFGIPFAQPPVGNLRFRLPISNEPWQGVFNATEPPNSPCQPLDTVFGDFSEAAVWNPNTPMSEDCLYLNVWIPKPCPKKAAVMAWIYGGGFYSGTSTLEVYDGSVLAAEENVIVVSFQYRVGALGFLYSGNGADDAPGNMGLYDQDMALQWIKDNIHLFGGDPSNVTIFGESAGAASVGLHLLSPHSRDLFKQAIMESSSASVPNATVSTKTALKRTLELAKRLQCQTDDMSKIIECLRKAPVQEIIDNQAVTDGLMEFSFVPVVDGRFIPQRPQAMLRSGAFKKANILTGSNSEEGSYFLMYFFDELRSLSEEVHVNHVQLVSMLERAFPHFSRAAKDAIIMQYTDWVHADDLDSLENVDILEKAVGDYHFTCPTNEMALAYVGAGQKVHMYFFNHRSSVLAWPKWVGCPHGYEIQYVFGLPLVLKNGYTKEEAELSKRIMSYWANFAKTGNPNLREQGESSKLCWPHFSLQGMEYITINTKDPIIGRGPRATQNTFWKRDIN